MGTRLHYAKKYDIEWAGDNFSYLQEEIYDLLSDYDILVNTNEGNTAYATDFEVAASDIEYLVSKLKERNPNEVLFTEHWVDKDIPYAIKDILPFFESALANAAKPCGVIHFSWF